MALPVALRSFLVAFLVAVFWAVPIGLQPGFGQGASPSPQSSSVEMRKGRPTIMINGEPRAPMVYALTDVPSGRWSWEELPQHNIENFCKRGVRLFQLDLFLEHVWPAPGEFDLGKARKQIAGVQEVCPGASIIFRFHVRAPRWWKHKHPDQWVAYADTGYVAEQKYGLLRIIEHDNGPVRRVSMASKKWRSQATEKFRRFLRELADTPEGNALAGIQVANGVYGEWHNWGFYYSEPDVSAPMEAAFQEWLREKYGRNAALQKAWNDPDATFETASVPGLKARATEGLFRSPTQQRRVIDYYECMHRVVADNIVHFSQVVKEEWPRPIITGTFYGYYFSTFGRQAAGGHLQLQRILEAESIDYLSGPQAYEPESSELGDPYRSRSLIASVRLHGKLWLDELDFQPKIPRLDDSNYETRLQSSVASVRRNVAFPFTKGMGLWFYDFGVAGVDLNGHTHQHAGSQGTWDHPIVMDDIERMKAIFERRMDEPYQSGADVLFVYDTESVYYTASLRGSDPVSPTLIDYTTLNAFRTGVLFDPLHIDDLDRVDLSQYDVVVFGNTYVLSDEERAFIHEKVARDGRDLVWFYAPGYLEEDGTGPTAEAISDLTEIELTPTSVPSAPTIEMALSADSTARYSLGDAPLKPLFRVTDDEAEPLGHFTQNDALAIARKSLDDHTAWYVGLPSKQGQPLQSILPETSAHIYSRQGDIVYGGSGLLVLHTDEGGTRTVTLQDGTPVSLELPKGPATVFLDSQTGEVLLKEYPTTTKEVKVQYE